MDRDDILDLLAIISAVDHRTTGEADVASWGLLIGKLPKDDCLDAIVAHRKEQPGVWLEPGHIARRVKAIREDRYQRADVDSRDRDAPYREIGGVPSLPAGSMRVGDDGSYIDAQGVRRDHAGYVHKGSIEIEFEDGWSTEQRLTHYWKHVKEPEYAGLRVRPATDAARQAAMAQIAETLGTLPI